MEGSFTFPTLRKPKPLPPQNPLLASTTVIDRSLAAGAGLTTQPTAVHGDSAADAAASDVDGMGGWLGKPVVLSRHHRIVPAPRKKVPFEKGFSPMDWVQLTLTHPDLAGLEGQRPRRGITMEEVAKHCTKDDAWTVLRGKVYNVTQYLRFHPGGMQLLLKVAGKDGTVLFNKHHAWVNADFLLAKCLVGLLAPPSADSGSGSGAGDAAAPAARGPPDAVAPDGSSNSSSTTDLHAAGQQQQQQQQEQQELGGDELAVR